MTTRELLRDRREEILRVLARHGAFNPRVFGSVVRDEDDSESDLDLLVETGPGTSSWFPAGLILDLEELLGRRVDVVTVRGLHPLLKDTILREARPL